MNKKNFSDIIVELRKEKGLTQQELANKLNITDKAVSKWERGLSYPDITSISKLAKTLDVESSYLIDLCKKEENPYQTKEDINNIINLILNGLSVAMGISVLVLNIMNKINLKVSITMLGIGLTCISILFLSNNNK